MLDKLTVKILKHIKNSGEILQSEVVLLFGQRATKSLKFLSNEYFITEEHNISERHEDNRAVSFYDPRHEITAKGYGFLEAYPKRIFDSWLTKTIAIWGAITGTISLLMQLGLWFQ